MLLNLAFCVLQHSFCSRLNRLCMVSGELLYNQVSTSLYTQVCICGDEGKRNIQKHPRYCEQVGAEIQNLCITMCKLMHAPIYSLCVCEGVEKGIWLFSTIQHPTKAISITRQTWDLKFHLTVTPRPLPGTSEYCWFLFNYTTMFALSLSLRNWVYFHLKATLKLLDLFNMYAAVHTPRFICNAGTQTLCLQSKEATFCFGFCLFY